MTSAAVTDLSELTARYSAHNYAPLPVVAASAEGAWITDVQGRRYLDMMAAYSALNFGHRNPRLIAAAMRQLEQVTLVSRAFDHDQFGPFCAELAELAGMEMVLPMNTGAEAVETAIKVARKWGYTVRGVPADQALIVVFDGNFHGRTTTIISFSSDPDARDDFGPYTPGFLNVPYGDLARLTEVLAEYGERVVAVLVEPIQGEAGVVVPPAGFLTGVRSLCSAHGILMIADEIQSGLGRTGFTFTCSAYGVVPDAYLLGKALGGGIVPVSAMVSSAAVLGVLQPGQHGSTFGGNPLACAIGREVIAMLRDGSLQERSASLGTVMQSRLAELPASVVSSVRGLGLWAGISFTSLSGREVCERLMAAGVLTKETHGNTIRLGPPLVITEEDLLWGMDRIAEAVTGLSASGYLGPDPAAEGDDHRGDHADRAAVEVPLARRAAGDDHAAVGHRHGQHEGGDDPAEGRRERAADRLHPPGGQQAGHQDPGAEGDGRRRRRQAVLEAADHAFHRTQQQQGAVSTDGDGRT
jgi:ornithine--oxo-acid transaminase